MTKKEIVKQISERIGLTQLKTKDIVQQTFDAIAARKAARAAKNFAESDRIRDDLLAKGIVLKDGPEGTSWEVKR